MISSLWSLCQTCPSVAASKLEAQHGKYRWTEYRDVSTAARVIEHAPQCSGHSRTESPARSHNDAAITNQEQQQPLLDSHNHEQHQGKQQQKKHPGEAHDFMEFTAIPAYLKFDNQQLLQGLRRSQSEGPGPQYHHSVHGPAHGVGAAAETGPMAAWVHGRRRHVTEQQRPEHWLISAPASAAGSVLAVETRAPTVHERQQSQQQQQQQNSSSSSPSVVQQQQQSNSKRSSEFNWPAGKPSRKMPESLDTLLHFTNEVPAVDTSIHQSQKHYHQMESSIQHKHNTNNEDQSQQNDQDQPRARRRYKTEYKKKYRPFSVYQYVDGRFQKSSSAADKIDSHDPKDPWYTEVVELRKKAGEYKYRGLGGEMMSDHLADLYSKQFDVWEQVSRRSSLSALALAAISPRATPEKENKSALSSASSSSGERKARGGSPAKTVPLGNHQAARPGHAQLVLISTRRATSKQAEERPRRDISQQRSYSAEGGSKARSKSVKPTSKTPTANVASASTAPASSTQTTGNHANNQRPSARSASVGPERRMPTGRNVSTPSGAPVTRTTPVKAPRSTAHNNNADVKESGEAVKVVKKKAEAKEEEEPVAGSEIPVVAEPEMPALIKAFPEPTRVKSPEQLLVRSPDPVNWTVPLDTGKTFTVTQNIASTSRHHSELKVTMTVRPAAPAHPVAVIKPQKQQQEPEIIKESTEAIEEVKQDLVAEDRAPSPAMSSAPTVASTLSAPEDIKVEENGLTDTKEDDVTPVPEEPVITKEPEATKTSPVIQHPLLTPEEPKETPRAAVSQIEAKIPAEPISRAVQPIPEAKAEEAGKAEEKPQTPAKAVDSQKVTAVPSDPLNVAAVLTKPKDEPLSAAVVRPVEPVIVPGTTLRRLEDPTPVLFSRPGTLGSLTGQPFAAVPAPAPVAPKGPRYRVLEAPGLVNEPAHPAMLPTSSPYRVLEAPVSPPKAVPNLAGSPSSSPMSSSRSLASDVLEKARTRFDRFWTKKDSDK